VNKPIKPIHPVNRRQKGWVLCCTFAFVEGDLPKQLTFRDWLIPFEGSEAEPSGNEMPWGIFGSNSLQAGLFLANNFAMSNKKTMVLLQTWYLSDATSSTNGALVGSAEDCNGILNLTRLTSKFRQEIRGELMTIIKEYRSGPHLIGLERLEWEAFLAAEPRAVREYLRRSKDLFLIAHPVVQQFDRTRSDVLLVASFKPDVKRVMAAEARYMEQIEVLV
jgi:hypothetical protein